MFKDQTKGFSLIELVVVIVLVSILAVFAIPKLNIDIFKQSGYVQQAAAAIRFAQKQAIASGCQITVSITAGGCSLNWYNPSANGSCPVNNTSIANPGTGDNNFCSNSTPASSAGLPVRFSFDKIGRPSSAQTINLGNRTIKVEAETGYTHEL